MNNVGHQTDDEKSIKYLLLKNGIKFTNLLDEQVAGKHYKEMQIQPIQYIQANNIPFIEGNIIKYVSRWRNKNGVEDLEKAKHFLEVLIEWETNGNR